MKNSKNIIWGIILIAIGLIAAGNALDIIDFNFFFDGWWTLFIIIPCLVGLFSEREKTGNLIGLIVGVALFLGCRDIINFKMIWQLALPTVLIIIGLSFIFKDRFNREVSDKIKLLNSANHSKNEYCATFTGQNANFSGEVFTGADLTAVFGGVKCNLVGSEINSDCVINCSAVFGGITIFVPDNVKVKIKSSSIFGGVSDNKKRIECADSPTVFINATCIFGGVEVK